MKIRFLLDQNLSPQIASALIRYNPSIDVFTVGREAAPPFGTLDPGILAFCETEQRVLVTENRSTIPIHEAAHFAAGRHHWGIFLLRHNLSIGELAFQLQLFWEASEAEEWTDQTEWLPY